MTDKQPEATPQVAEQQQSAKSWPRPGDEGYVHPDGTPQSVKQREDNERAAADRAAAGSTVHGAPMATPGPQVQEQAEAAQRRAEEYSGPSVKDAQRGVTDFVADKSAEVAEEQSATTDQPAKATAKNTRTADDSKPTEKR